MAFTQHDGSRWEGDPTRDDPPPGALRTVTGCADCPFVDRDNWDKYDPRCGLEGRDFYRDEGWRTPDDPPTEPPDWCPLREGDITVRLER